MDSSTWCGVALLFMIIGGTGCVCSPRAVPVGADVTFAAHSDHCGIAVDRMQDEQRGLLAAAGSPLFSGGPRWVFRAKGATIAAAWLQDSQAIIRRTRDKTSPSLGQVDATWESLAIRLTLTEAGGSSFRTGPFYRVGGSRPPAAIGQTAASQLDVRGVYRAEVVDPQGRVVGWLRVQIAPYQAAARIYDGVLPAELNGPLAAVAVARLDSEIDWMEYHATNPWIGQDAPLGSR